MRKVLTAAFVSLDGVMQAPGGPHEDPSGGFRLGGWLAPLGDDPVFGEEIGAILTEPSKPYDLLLGRKTYEIFAAYWPFAEGGAEDTIAKRFNAARKYVATRKGLDLTWKGSVALGNAAEDVAKLKKDEGPTLVTQGSADLVQTLLANDLIDEMKLFTFPIILGRGKKLLAGGARPAALRLTSSKVSPKGVIVATYVRDGDVRTGDLTTDPPSPAEVARREKWER